MTTNVANAQNSTAQHQEKNTFINPKALFNPTYNGFSHIGSVSAGAELVFISGQWASDETGKLTSTDFEQQVRKTIQNLKIALQAAGVSTRHIIKQTIFIADFTPEKKAILGKVAAAEWGAEVFPASTIVPVPVLATTPGCLIEVESIATK